MLSQIPDTSIVSQNGDMAVSSLRNKTISSLSDKYNQAEQLSLFPSSNTALSLLSDEKPQIKSIPGAPIKEKFRYRVALGGEILGDKLSLEQAAELAGLEGRGVKP